MKNILIILTLLWLTSVNANSQSQPSDKVDSIKLAENIFLLRSDGRIGNPNSVALIGPEGVFLVDSSFSSFSGKLTLNLRELGGARIKFIVNTHWHGDHTAGNEIFGSAATIIARANVRKRLLRQGILEDNGRLIRKAGLPTITYESQMTLYFANERIEIIPMTAGHTDGDTIVFFKNAKVLSVGDYFFLNRFPVIDSKDSGADLDGYLRNIKLITERFHKDVKIAPGHSDFQPKPLRSATMADLYQYHAILTESVEIVRQKKVEGQSLSEIQKGGLPDKFRRFGERPRFVSTDAWIETIYKNSPKKPERGQ